MSVNIFYRKADCIPSKQLFPQDLSTKSDIENFIVDVFGEKCRSLEIMTRSTFHNVYQVAFKEREIILKIAKYQETKETLSLENFLYSEILSPLLTGGAGLNV